MQLEPHTANLARRTELNEFIDQQWRSRNLSLQHHEVDNSKGRTAPWILTTSEGADQQAVLRLILEGEVQHALFLPPIPSRPSLTKCVFASDYHVDDAEQVNKALAHVSKDMTLMHVAGDHSQLTKDVFLQQSERIQSDAIGPIHFKLLEGRNAPFVLLEGVRNEEANCLVLPCSKRSISTCLEGKGFLYQVLNYCDLPVFVFYTGLYSK